MLYRYHVYGLTLESELECPELAPEPADAAVVGQTIRVDPVSDAEPLNYLVFLQGPLSWGSSSSTAGRLLALHSSESSAQIATDSI